eukprot:6297997-Pyramimonas_sp.AAC.1
MGRPSGPSGPASPAGVGGLWPKPKKPRPGGGPAGDGPGGAAVPDCPSRTGQDGAVALCPPAAASKPS